MPSLPFLLIVGAFLKFRTELSIGKFDSAPITIHWSALLALLCSWAVTKSFVAGIVGFVAYVAMLLAHELGHAVVARAYHLKIISIQTFWMHGLCVHQSTESPRATAAIAWGGVAAQAVLFVLALILANATAMTIGAIPAALSPLFFVWIPINLLTIFYNLLPIPPLDGAVAWKMLPMLWRTSAK